MTLYLVSRRVLLCLCLCMGIPPALAQNTILSSGNWDDTNLWSGANIADVLGENVAFLTSSGITATVEMGTSYTVGNVDLQSNSIVVQGTLDIGQSGSPKNVTAGNSASLSTTTSTLSMLTIWGDITAGESFQLSSVSQIIVKGDVNLAKNSAITIFPNKTIKIEGNLTLGDDTFGNILAGATLEVDGDIIAGAGSSTIGALGAIIKGRSCSGPPEFCGGVILPIRLLEFNADVAGDEVQVKWSTATEINVDYIVVQRSVDGHTFADIGKVKAFGNSSTIKNYSLTDHEPVIGNLYYRLHSVDFDGKEEFSRVIAVRYLSSSAVQIFPNPAGKQVNIQLNFIPAEQTTHVLTDLYGRTIAQFTTRMQRETLQVPDIKPGVYFLKTKSGKDIFLNRIVFTGRP
ncbi:MAG TPA: T9SS type A sorting domain-containing protein [Chryseolinea sp.]